MKFDYQKYEILLESLGGLGANLCGKLLGEFGALCLGLNACSFSSYGSEKRGSPVNAYIRYAPKDREILVNDVIENPDLIGIFNAHAARPASCRGAGENTKVVINTPLSADEIRDKLQLFAGEIYCIDALSISLDIKSRINMIMLGAICRAMGFVELDALAEFAESSVGKKYPELARSNVAGVRRGFEDVSSRHFENDGKYPPIPFSEVRPDWGYETAPPGGVNPLFGSTVSNDLSAAREGYMPVLSYEKCINCGLCDSTCPDMVFRFEERDGNLKNAGLDYRHCKGCLRCVGVCPTGALTAVREADCPNPPHSVQNKDLIDQNIDFDAAGANSWVTSDSYSKEEVFSYGENKTKRGL